MSATHSRKYSGTNHAHFAKQAALWHIEDLPEAREATDSLVAKRDYDGSSKTGSYVRYGYKESFRKPDQVWKMTDWAWE